MANPSIPGKTTATTRAAASIEPRLSARAVEDTVFVELGQAAQKAQIARDGVAVPLVALNATLLTQVLAGKPQVVAKVVQQSVPPGTAVPKGTSIDIVLAEPRQLPTKIIQGAHIALQERPIGQIYDTFLRDNVAVRSVIARNERVETLSTADQGVLQAAFAQADVPITTAPGQTIVEAFQTLQGAFSFGS